MMDPREASALIERLNRDAERIARRFALRYHSIEAERPQVRRRYGVCFADGRIRIRLRHVSTGRSLKYSSLVNTLCHELAHLRHFNHGPRFKAFYFHLLDWARVEGIYQPRALASEPALALSRSATPPRSDAAPRTSSLGAGQLELFREERLRT